MPGQGLQEKAARRQPGLVPQGLLARTRAAVARLEKPLDLAVNTRVDLRAGGRMVGVISPVAGLRERMDVRLEISTGSEGRSAGFVLP